MLRLGIPFDGSSQEGECDGVVSARRKLAESQEPKPLSRVSWSHPCFSPWGHVNWQIVAYTEILQLYPQLFMGGCEVGVVFPSRMARLRAVLPGGADGRKVLKVVPGTLALPLPALPSLFLFLWPKYTWWRLDVRGQQASGITIITRRQWLACLSSKTCNLIVSRAQTRKTHLWSPLFSASWCQFPTVLRLAEFLPPYTHQKDHSSRVTHPRNVVFQHKVKESLECSSCKVGRRRVPDRSPPGAGLCVGTWYPSTLHIAWALEGAPGIACSRNSNWRSQHLPPSFFWGLSEITHVQVFGLG